MTEPSFSTSTSTTLTTFNPISYTTNTENSSPYVLVIEITFFLFLVLSITYCLLTYACAKKNCECPNGSCIPDTHLPYWAARRIYKKRSNKFLSSLQTEFNIDENNYDVVYEEDTTVYPVSDPHT